MTIPGNGIEIQFARRVGLVAGAILTVILLANALAGILTRSIVLPAVADAIADEREAREKADRSQIATIARVARDQLDLLDAVGAPPERRARIMIALRRRWAALATESLGP